MSGPSSNQDFFTYADIHGALKKLKKTATGPDGMPYWFFKISPDHFTLPLTDLINESIKQSRVPTQWKCAAISPIPKVSKPVLPTDYRPISITSVLSRLTERLLVKKYLNKAIQNREEFNDQYAFRPSGSTTAAIIAITKAITDNLELCDYVRVLALDFSKAFDTVKHHALFTKLSQLGLNKEIYNWMLDFFKEHQHYTVFEGAMSNTATINSGVIQGSVLGPFAYVIVASDLKTVNHNNSLIKYADDIYLIIPSHAAETTHKELENVQAWAATNNLKLNCSKTKEIIFKKPRRKAEPAVIDEIERVENINILGITITQHLTTRDYISALIKKCHSNIYAIKLLKNRGLDEKSVHTIYRALIINRILYACQSWWGYATLEDKGRIEKLVKRSARFGYCRRDINITATVAALDDSLFKKIQNSNHVLHHLLPPETTHGRNLRSTDRSHNRARTCLASLSKKHFIYRLIHKDAFITTT